MTVKDLRKLCDNLEKEGYEDSEIYQSTSSDWYTKAKVYLVPNEYGDVVISVRV